MLNQEKFYIAQHNIVVVGSADKCIISVGKSKVTFTTENLDGVLSLFKKLRTPISGSDLSSIVDSISGLSSVVSVLIKNKFLIEDEKEKIEDLFKKRSEIVQLEEPLGKVVIGISGAVSSNFMLSQLVPLIKKGFCQEIDVILTESAQKFITEASFNSCGVRTWTNPFKYQNGVGVPHIELASKADIVLIMPASARTISKLVNGECSDLLSLVVAATKAPVVVVPAMNEAMWDHPPIARNISKLRKDGFYVVEPSVGLKISSLGDNKPSLVYGGAGLQNSDDIFNILKNILAMHKKKAK